MSVIILEAVILAASLSLDTFAAGLAYGSNKIKIPFLSIQIINLICSSILGVSLFLGTIVKQYLTESITTTICFTILFILGIVKLFDSITKSIIRKYSNLNREIKFSMFNFKFILNLYADPEKADADLSKLISPAEAAALSISLSLDGMAVGFGAALGTVNVWAVFFASVITGMIAITSGCYLGNKLAARLTMNMSWLSGVILIILAVMKLS